jgi:hypothetical protein
MMKMVVFGVLVLAGVQATSQFKPTYGGSRGIADKKSPPPSPTPTKQPPPQSQTDKQQKTLPDPGPTAQPNQPTKAGAAR